MISLRFFEKESILFRTMSALRIASFLFIAPHLSSCSSAREFTSLDIAKAGNKAEFDAKIGYNDTFPFGDSYFLVMLGVSEVSGLQWYESCYNANAGICSFPGRYHIKIFEVPTNKVVLDVIPEPKSGVPDSFNKTKLVDTVLTEVRLSRGQYKVSVENLENVSVFKNTDGQVWLTKGGD